jgi:aspartate carbamoyltransferase catalytic subunit
VFTIQERFGKIDGIKIAMVGDLKNGRTVRSLSYILSKFDGVTIYFVSPQCAQMKDDIKAHLLENQVKFYESNDLRDIAPVVDVVYQTRTQTECGASFERNKTGFGFFLVDETVTRKMRKDAIIMHPLPRVDEISPEVDDDSRAVYLTNQIDSGLYTRMALLKMILAPEA